MAFSLSPPPPSRALGRNGGLVVLFKLFVLLDSASGAAFRAVVAHQVRAESIERNNLVRVSFEDCGARHAADDAGVFTLRNGHSARRLDRTEPLGPIISHAGQDRKSTRLNSSHDQISYAVFCLKKKKKQIQRKYHEFSIYHNDVI